MLYIVPTPIGNLKDITLRALEIFQEVDTIICEDTRHSGILLNYFQIKKPLLMLNDYNEAKNFPRIIDRLRNGEKMAIISDAGTPLISDPGYKLIRECIKEGIPVDSLPGAASPIVALTLSGLPPDKFMFMGFFPDKSGHRQRVYEQLTEINNITPVTFIFFVAPFKINKTLEEMKETLGDIDITLAKELTKIHQNVKTQKISEWLIQFKKANPRGEWVMLVRI